MVPGREDQSIRALEGFPGTSRKRWTWTRSQGWSRERPEFTAWIFLRGSLSCVLCLLGVGVGWYCGVSILSAAPVISSSGTRVSGRTMAKGATSKSNHSLSLSFVILLSYLGATLPDGEFSGAVWRGWVTEHGHGLSLEAHTWATGLPLGLFFFPSRTRHLGSLISHHPAISGLRKEVMKQL